MARAPAGREGLRFQASQSIHGLLHSGTQFLVLSSQNSELRFFFELQASSVVWPLQILFSDYLRSHVHTRRENHCSEQSLSTLTRFGFVRRCWHKIFPCCIDSTGQDRKDAHSSNYRFFFSPAVVEVAQADQERERHTKLKLVPPHVPEYSFRQLHQHPTQH